MMLTSAFRWLFWALLPLLVQYDAGRQAWWVLSDAGGDVVAIAKRHGVGASAHGAC
jgi:hypothetical protein